MKRFKISWFHKTEYGGHELHSPWWYTGEAICDENIRSIEAALLATSEEDAKKQILQCYDNPPETLEWRFCREMPDDWSPFNRRRPRADWMQWPDEQINNKEKA